MSVKLILENERPMSLNSQYARMHWAKRNQETRRVKQLVRTAIDPNEAHVFTVPVDITITAYFDKNPYDPDNIAEKPYIDALKGWYIEDDTGLNIMSVTKRSRVDEGNPRLEIEIES